MRRTNNHYDLPSNDKYQCPINVLPPEILGHIFEIGVQEGPGREDRTSGSILVSHVCRRWREVALNLHTLWTTLDFDNVLRLERSKVFIERASVLPLKIRIVCTMMGHSQDEGLMQILDLIEPEVSRWEKLEFHASTYSYVQFFLSRLHKISNAPLLKEFYIDYNHEYSFGLSNGDKTSYLPFHGNAPLLESAIFHGVHIDWNNSFHFLQGLREFELSLLSDDVQPSYATFTQIIKNSPELRTLSLALSEPLFSTGAQFISQWGPEPFEIPSVHHLTLYSNNPPFVSALVQHFYFPNLRSLSMVFSSEDHTSFVRKLLVPVKGRSRSILPGLENLNISWLFCDIAVVEAMLKQLTNLKAFELNGIESEELAIFRKLIDPMAEHEEEGEIQVNAVAQTLPEIFCPLLETFTIVTSVGEDQIRSLVMARKVGGAPLKTLKLSHKDCISVETQEWLKGHVEMLEFF